MSFPEYPDYAYGAYSFGDRHPKHWKTFALKRIFHLVTKKEGQAHFRMGLENVESWSGAFVESETVYEGEGISFEKGDILFGKLRPYLAKVYLSPKNGEAVGDFYVFRPRHKCSGRFLQYSLLNRACIDLINSTTFGAKMPRASWDSFSDIVFVLPQAHEQHAIAAFLDRETSKIDELIAEQEKLIELLKEKRQAVISHSVTKGLDPNVKMKDSGVEWIGDVPESWTTIKLTYVTKLESGHTPSRSKPEYWVDCDTPWFTLADVSKIRSGNIRYVFETSELVSKFGLENSSARLLPKGSVFLSRTASVGYPGIMGVDMATSQDFAVWICGPRLINEFLHYCLLAMKGEFSRLMMGSTHKTIYMPDIEAFRIPLPPVETQSVLVSYLDATLAQYSSVSEAAVNLIELLKERRSAMISAAVTGKIDVRSLVSEEEIEKQRLKESA